VSPRPNVRVRNVEGAWSWASGATPAVAVSIDCIPDVRAVLDRNQLWFRGNRVLPARMITLADVPDGQYAFVHAAGKVWELVFVG